MCISEFSGDAYFSLALFAMLTNYMVVTFINKIDRFTNGDGDRLNEFETILQ